MNAKPEVDECAESSTSFDYEGRSATGVVVALSALSACLALSVLSDDSVWVDEVHTIEVARATGHDFVPDLLHNGGNMSLYLVFMRFWLLFGESEFWLRLPSAVFAVASVPVLFCVARRLVSARAALMATVLFASAAPLIDYAKEGRSYSLFLLLVLAAWLSLLRTVESESGYGWFVALATLSIYAHLIAVVFVAAQLLWLASATSTRSSARIAMQVALFASPQFAVALRPDAARPDWVPPLSSDSLSDTLHLLTGSPSDLAGLVVLCVWMAGGVIALRGTRLGARGSVAPVWALLPVVGVLAVSVVKPLLVPRYLLPVVPAGAILVAVAFDRLRRVGWFAVAALVVCSLPALDQALEPRNPDWRSTAASLFERSEPEDGIVFINGSRHLIEYYWVRQGRPAPPTHLTEPERWDRPQRQYPMIDPAAAIEASQAKARIWVVHRSTESGVPTAAAQAFEEALAESRRTAYEIEVPGIQVTLYER